MPTYNRSAFFVVLAVLVFALTPHCCFAAIVQTDAADLKAGETRMIFDAADIAGWQEIIRDGSRCLVSPAIGNGRDEINLHRLLLKYGGTGKISVAVAHAHTKDRQAALSKKSTAGYMQSAPSGRLRKLSSYFKNERYAWVILKIEGDVEIESVTYTFHQSTGTLFGHVPLEYKFAGAGLPCRLMFPRGYSPAKEPEKLYPLVISVAGSGSVGVKNVKNMEIYILAQHLYTRYYDNPDFACFSLVPQLPPTSVIPAPYYPAGPKGAPSPTHPDWPTVNADGWFTQATVAMVKELIASRQLKIDPDRIYFTGFSYGGKACWEFLKAAPDLFAGAIAVAGWPIGQAYSNPAGSLLKALRNEVKIYKDVPVAIYAGEKDPMRYGSKAAYECLLEAGGTATYTEIPGANHLQSAGKTWAYTKNIAWLFDQKRNSAEQVKTEGN